MRSKIFLIILVILMSLSITGVCAPLSEEPWRVIYQLYVRSFYDGSPIPDGHGDFKGLIYKLPYLKDLGVDTILLMPIFESTGGMGYIPKDYFKLDNNYGHLQDFKDFIYTAKSSGFKIILDTPVNHISDDSYWFKRGSQKNCDPNDIAYNPNDPDNIYCDFFYFSSYPWYEYPYSNWHKPWKYDKTDWSAVWYKKWDFNPVYHRNQYYYATFFQVMPDLKFYDFHTANWNWPVVNTIKYFFKYWASLGVDGFRIDAAKHFVEGTANNANEVEPKNIELLNMFLSNVRSINPAISFIAEIWASHQTIESYIPQASDMALDFPFMDAIRHAVFNSYGAALRSVLFYFESRQDKIKAGSRILFSGNHDVTRLMSLFNDDEEKFKMAHFLTLTLPFTVLLYYGEELGMHGVVKRPDSSSDEEYVRTINAFSWDNSNYGGFPSNPIEGLADNYLTRNLQDQKANPSSSWYFIKNLISLRKSFGLTNNSKLYVNQDLYGHVLGYTITNPISINNLNYKCRIIAVNFNQYQSYDVLLKPASHLCSTNNFKIMLSENAKTLNFLPNTGVFYRLNPNARVIIDTF